MEASVPSGPPDVRMRIARHSIGLWRSGAARGGRHGPTCGAQHPGNVYLFPDYIITL